MSLFANTCIPIAVLFTFLYLLYELFFLPKHNKLHHKLHSRPPGPRPLPLIGNLHILGNLPHRKLQSLAKKYGSIMSLKLGQVQAIVISSPEAAQLIFKTYDIVFATRPKTQAYDYLSYGFKGTAFAEYGPYWRHVKKLCTVQLLSAPKVDNFAPLRREKLCLVVKSLQKASSLRQTVNLSEVLHVLTEDIVFKMTFGPNTNKDTAFNYKDLVQEGMVLAGAFNLADYLPWLRPFDLQGLKRRLKKCQEATDELLEKIIKDKEEGQKATNKENYCQSSFIDILLSLMNQPIGFHEEEVVVDRTMVKAIIIDMFAAALEASAVVIEWVLAELINNPRVMNKLQHEIQGIVGMNRMVEEIDLMKLSYLDLIVKETLRLHPAGSMIPREAREDIIIDGYYIKKKTMVLVNSWSLGRDPKLWSDNAESFYPERFINNDVDVRGQHFQLIPFGSGRRQCPGMRMGLAIIKLVVAQLVHCFDWELPYGIKPQELDMSETFGLTIPRAKHLLAIPTCRLNT